MTGDSILELLRTDGVEVDQLDVRVYDTEQLGWTTLRKDVTFDALSSPPRRIDIQIFRQPYAESLVKEQEDGYFMCGVMGMKNVDNLGTLWRSCYQLGAASMFLIGDRFSSHRTDVVKSFTKIPMVEYPDWNSFVACSAYGAKWVAVEMGGEPLETFEHPKRAIYILGSEDNGLPESVIRSCHSHVALPSIRFVLRPHKFPADFMQICFLQRRGSGWYRFLLVRHSCWPRGRSSCTIAS
uniref:tRNA/rRNA methyltransferase SpoU type domain-containing protein n=1 Tax=Guillardia theta (strain CCMP2712) TaxID=905079 RepID=A0A0C3UH32_GUITC